MKLKSVDDKWEHDNQKKIKVVYKGEQGMHNTLYGTMRHVSGHVENGTKVEVTQSSPDVLEICQNLAFDGFCKIRAATWKWYTQKKNDMDNIKIKQPLLY